jgi:hypothetical protein
VGIGNNYSGIGPERGKEFIFYMGLVSQADTKTLKANPTLAAGDFKVSIDGGAFNNLGTTPSVTPASGKAVKITLSVAEMTGDNITVVAADASGAEWCDRMISIQTSPGALQAIELATVDTSPPTATTTEFETGDITEATANHYVGRAIVFTSGVLKGQAATIMAYSLVSGLGHFTVTELTEAPGDGDKFLIV